MISYTGDIKYGQYTTAPLGWLLCDGSSIPSVYSALRAMVGNSTPNHVSRMPMGGTGGQVGNTGGDASVTVPLPQHDHNFTGSSHSHGFSGGSHTHGFSGGNHSHATFPTLGQTSGANVMTGGQGNTGWRAFANTTSGTQSASAGGTVQSASTGGTVQSASTGGTVQNAGVANAQISTLSPYVVCLAIIKV